MSGAVVMHGSIVNSCLDDLICRQLLVFPPSSKLFPSPSTGDLPYPCAMTGPLSTMIPTRRNGVFLDLMFKLVLVDSGERPSAIKTPNGPFQRPIC